MEIVKKFLLNSNSIGLNIGLKKVFIPLYDFIKTYYSSKTSSDFFTKIKKTFKFKPSIKTYKLSSNSILIENNDFDQSLKFALKYLKVKKKENLIWKKVYYSFPTKDKLLDAYKFIHMSDINDLLGYLADDKEDYDNYLNINFKTTRKGIYIKLFSILHNKEVTLKLIRYKLKKITDSISPKIINKIYDNKMEWIKVGEWKPNSDIDAKLILENSNDLIKVYARKIPPKMGGKIIDEIDVKKALSQKKIVYGIDDELIKQFVESSTSRGRFLIVKAKDVIDGTNSQFEEVYKNSNKKLQIESKEKHIKPIYSVKKDEIIIKKIHFINKDNFGINIYGNKIFPTLGEDVDITPGENTHLDKKGNLLSSINGEVVKKEDIYSVFENLKLNKVGIKTGNIEHSGSVLIDGDIDDGYKVVALGTIEINGNIGNAIIEADGDIYINLGVSGKNKASIKSNYGSIYSKYLQNTTVYAKENVIVRDLISSSKVIAGNKIVVTNTNGRIWGGDLYALNTIKAGNIGSISNWKTILNLGISIELLDKITRSREKISLLKAKLIKNRKLLSSKGLKVSDKFGIDTKIDEIETEIAEENTKLAEYNEVASLINTQSSVVALLKIYPSVVININQIKFENKSERLRVVFGIFNEDKKYVQMERI